MQTLRLPLTLTLAAIVALATGCSASGGISPEEVTQVPESWIADTAEGWPSSDAFGASMPVLSKDSCELISEKQLPEILGEKPEITNSGWGPLGRDHSSEDSYTYECSIWSSGNYAGSLRLLHPQDAAQAESIVSDFDQQRSIPEQENTVTQEEAYGLTMSVLTRWYPTNPQGLYAALYHDEEAQVLVEFEINSLNEADFDAFSAQETAETLVEILAAGS